MTTLTSVFFFRKTVEFRGVLEFQNGHFGSTIRLKRLKLSVLDLRWMHVASIGPPGDAPKGMINE